MDETKKKVVEIFDLCIALSDLFGYIIIGMMFAKPSIINIILTFSCLSLFFLLTEFVKWFIFYIFDNDHVSFFKYINQKLSRKLMFNNSVQLKLLMLIVLPFVELLFWVIFRLIGVFTL